MTDHYLRLYIDESAINTNRYTKETRKFVTYKIVPLIEKLKQ